MYNHSYPPADFQFPPGLTFDDMEPKHAELARKMLYFLVFDPDVQQVMDNLTEETYEADMKERDRMENDGCFDDVYNDANEDPDEDYFDPFVFDNHFSESDE